MGRLVSYQAGFTRALALFTLSGFFLFGLVYADNDNDHDEALKLLRSGKILSLAEILKRNKNKLHGAILEVELENEDNQLIYEIELLKKDGIVWEVKINAKNGVIIKLEEE